MNDLVWCRVFEKARKIKDVFILIYTCYFPFGDFCQYKFKDNSPWTIVQINLMRTRGSSEK